MPMHGGRANVYRRKTNGKKPLAVQTAAFTPGVTNGMAANVTMQKELLAVL